MANMTCCSCGYSGYMIYDQKLKRMVCRKCYSQNLASDEYFGGEDDE